MKTRTRIGALVAGAALALTITAPASAATINAAFEDIRPHIDSIPYIGAACPYGEGFLSGTATFYKKPYMQGDVIAVVEGVVGSITSPSEWPNGVFAPVPKQARSVSTTFTCVPTGEAVDITGTFTSESLVTVECPEESPYLVHVGPVVIDSDGDLNTTQDQYSPHTIQIETGVQFQGPVGHLWQATLICSTTLEIGT